jgi:hypothetical protein
VSSVRFATPSPPFRTGSGHSVICHRLSADDPAAPQHLLA